MQERILFDRDRCTGCRLCVDVCPQQSLLLENGLPVVINQDCFLCGHCRAVCPADAVTIPHLPDRLGLTTIDETDMSHERGSVSVSSFVKLLRNHRSTRNYLEQPVPHEILADLARIGTTCGSGTNSQGWEFTILPTRADVLAFGGLVAKFYSDLNRLSASLPVRLYSLLRPGNGLNRYHKNYYNSVSQALRDWDDNGTDRLFHGGTAAMVVSVSREASCPREDGMLATGNIVLAAEAMGLGSCLIGFAVEAMRRRQAICDFLSLQKDFEVCSVISLGYPAVSFKRFSGRKEARVRWCRPSEEESDGRGK